MSEIDIISVVSKLRPYVERERTIELDDIADNIAMQSGFERGNARDMADKMAREMISQLMLGNYVKLGEIGGFSVTCNKIGFCRRQKIFFSDKMGVCLRENFEGRGSGEENGRF